MIWSHCGWRILYMVSIEFNLHRCAKVQPAVQGPGPEVFHCELVWEEPDFFLILTLWLEEISKTHTPIVSWNIHESSESSQCLLSNELYIIMIISDKVIVFCKIRHNKSSYYNRELTPREAFCSLNCLWFDLFVSGVYFTWFKLSSIYSDVV